MPIKTNDELLELFNSGKLIEYKSQNLELKRSWKQDNGKKISFLANKNLQIPSWLVIGINDDGTDAGFDESWVKPTEESISQHLNQYLDPSQSVRSILCIEAKASVWIIIIEIVNPGAVVRWDGKAYKGTGTTLQEMAPEEVMELTIKLPGLSDFTAQRFECEIDEAMVKMLIDQIGEKQKSEIFRHLVSLPPQDFLRELQLINTNACRFLFGRTPYRIVSFDNNDEPELNETRYGIFNLLSNTFIDELVEIIHKLNGRPIQLPFRAVMEGLAKRRRSCSLL